MTTKPPSAGLAASGPADDPDSESEQITKEHSDGDAGQDISIDPSEDVTVEATEDVTVEATSRTPHPTLRGGGAANATPGTVGTSAAQRAPTLLGVPIQSLPLPGLSASGETTRTIDYDDEITVLAQAAPIDPFAALDALDRPSITDDDEEETKVEPAEAAMKAAESTDDVTTALSAQASLEREKALRRSAPPAAAPTSRDDDLEFADPESEEEEESLDDELDDDDEVISAGGAVEEEREAQDEQEDEEDDGASDGVATSTFMKPADSTGLSGLLSPRRPPTGNPYGRDGFGGRLPTPYPPPQSPIPGPSTSPFASRLGPAPVGAPYGGRATGASMPAIQVPPPSGKATMETEPGFFVKRVPVPAYGLVALVAGVFIFGYGFGAMRSKSAPAAPTVIVAKPTAAPAPVAAAPVVEPVAGAAAQAPAAEPKPATPPAEATAPKAAVPTPTVTEVAGSGEATNPSDSAPEAGMWKQPAKKPVAPKPHKLAAVDTGEDAALKAKPAVAMAKPIAPKPPVEKAAKPAAAPAAKPAKKTGKVWVDPFAN